MIKSRTIPLIICILISFLFSGCSFGSVSKSTIKTSFNDLGAPTPKPVNGQLVFRLADNWSSDFPSVLGDKEFARLVEERSGGKIKILVYPDAALGDEKSVIEQVQLGGIDFARVNSAPLTSVSGKMSVLSLPFIFRDSDHLWKVLLGQIGDELLNSLDEGNVTGLAYYDSGARSFYTKVPITKVSDLKGLRLRVQQSTTFESFIKSLGAIPVPLPFGEVYNSLQTGEIDGAENNWSSYYFTNHYKIAKYYILDEHTRNPEVLIASSKLMEKLTKEQRELIVSCAKDSVALQRKEWNKSEAKSEDIIRKSGAVIIKLDDNEKTALEEAVSPLYEQYGKDYKDIIRRIINTK